MGLSISVGPALDGLGAALADEGIIWHGPYATSEASEDSTVGGFPYSFLHYLRRVYALVDNDEPVTPVRDKDDLSRDQHWVSRSMAMLDSHLLCHSDSD